MPISNYKELIQTLNWDDEKRTQERWYIFLLMNPRYQTNAGIDIIQNFSYLNLRSKNVTLFLPGLSNLDEGVVPYRSNHGHKIVYKDDSFGAIYFDERGFLETIDWLEEGSGHVYKYSEDLDLVIVKYYPRYTGAFANEAYEQNFDLTNMVVYNLDELKRNGKNVIKFIMDCRDVVSDSKSESEIRQRLNRFSNNLQPLIQNMDNADEYDVFISYSRKDYVDGAGNVIRDNILSKIKETLKANGRSYWFDEEGIYSGDEFASVITRAIRNSKIFLFISSANSNQSKWTSNEISTALEFGKPIIPFRLDDSPYNDSVMMKIVSLDFIEGKDVEKALNKLLRAINHHLLSSICQQETSTTVPERLTDSDHASAPDSSKADGFKLLKGRKALWAIIAVMLLVLIGGGIITFCHEGKTEDDPLIETVPIDNSNLECHPVNLGLSSGTMWADRNIGAATESDFGNLYSWGETKTKEEYSISTYDERLKPIQKINQTRYDVAVSELGLEWSIPSEEQFKELLSECKWCWKKMDGHNGFEIEGKNGNRIFLPASGWNRGTEVEYQNQFGYYWTSDRSLNTRFARSLRFPKDGKGVVDNGDLYVGRSVRAVFVFEAVAE